MFFQFVERRAAGGHGEYVRADGPTAFDVQRRVANHHDFFAAQFPAMQTRPAMMRGVGDLIAILVIVRKRAGDEVIPEIEVAQFDFRAEPDVAGEQAERGRFGQRLQITNQLPDAGTGFRLAVSKNVVEPEHIALEEA
jgi:hypothetical protein